MDKAEKAALEKYPHEVFDNIVGSSVGDSLRAACMVGYHQAEKDMQIIPAEEAYTKGFNDGLKERLTWEDAQLLHIITEKYMRELDNRIEAYPSSSQELFEEVLRRFYEKKK